jgi:competence protein ComEA
MKLTVAIVIFSSLLPASCRGGGERADAPGAAAANRNAALIAAAPRPPCVNLNQATAAELMKLPGVGEVMSRRIVEYRERHGPFRRPAEIILIEGFSENKYRAIADQLCVE